MGQRVRIGTCANPAHAALVRSLFAANQIHVAIGGEQHASLMGGLGGGFISLDITVDASDAERARALLAELEQPADRARDGDDDDERAGMEDLSFRLERRKRMGAAIALALLVTFGTAHLSAGAWRRALMCAALEIFGIYWLAHCSHSQQWMAASVIGVAIVGDAVGACRVLARRYSAQLPKAQLKKRATA